MKRLGGVSQRPAKGRRTNRPKAGEGSTARISTDLSTEEIARLKHERDEALEQKSAISEVLRVIAGSAADDKSVFDLIAKSAAQHCDARLCHVFRFDGELIHCVATYGYEGEVRDIIRRGYPMPPGRDTAAARAILGGVVEQIPDVQADPEYKAGNNARVANFRSIVAVPMLKAGHPTGAIAIARPQIGYFPERQIELLRTFADQAVIAIENTRLLKELRESLEQQTATSDVLQVISSSLGELEPVFNAMLENATRICEANFGMLFQVEDGAFSAAAMFGVPVAFAEFWNRGPQRPGARTALGRVADTLQTVHIADVKAEPAYVDGETVFVAAVNLGGFRTAVIVPMVKDGVLVGAFSIYRQEVRPFTEKQIELVTNFAAQAVIAIENARLLNELRQRTDDLTESLEQQTATSEVLKVISSSAGELQPVFEALLANATRLCSAKFGNLYICEGEAFRTTAMHNVPPAFAEMRMREPLVQPEPGSLLRRLFDSKTTVRVPDATKEQAYIDRLPRYVSAVEVGGFRSMIAVPMLKDDALIGAIIIYRQEVGDFADKQIELVQNFAAQAVIALENARLLNELRESLEQQTATSEVLKVISSSPGELEPVFQAMLENATRLCDAKFGSMYVREGEESLRIVALHGAPAAFAEERRRNPVVRPGPLSGLGHIIRTKQILEVPDLSKTKGYLERDPLRVAQVELAGARTYLAVPMLKDGELVGAITIYRQEVRPFTEKQIELVQNFAAQAVIAIENTRLLSELRESLEQQTATSEVLGVISSSPGDLGPVFDAMLANAVRVCGSTFGAMHMREGDMFRTVALHGALPAFFKSRMREGPFKPGPATGLARAAETRTVVHIADITAEKSYQATRDSLRRTAIEGGIRTLLVVPMLKNGEVLGVIATYRSEVNPFTDKQVELVQNFAAQAVIAIENARLLSELCESLEQQTATSEVLKIISSSPGELEPVFKAMLESATRICDANLGSLFLHEGDTFRAVAVYGDSEYADWSRRDPIVDMSEREHKGTPLDRLTRAKSVLHIHDLREDESFVGGNPRIRALVETAGARTHLVVPMLKDDALIGAIVIYRQVVHPFDEKQIELVTTFAAQAVIAIENARLLNELRESLQQQTATADVLKVISRSTFDLQVVLDTLVGSAARLCDTDMAAIIRLKNSGYQHAASFGYPPETHAFMLTVRMEANRESVAGRVALEGKAVQVLDVLDDPEYKMADVMRTAGGRTVLGVPLLRQGAPIGVLLMIRRQVRAFTEKQIELITTFADQAVIAIENVRLFDEVQARTDDLQESLAQQTATADVLKIISRATFDLPTVLDTLLRSAAQLCDADMGAITQRKGEKFYRAVAFGLAQGFIDRVKDEPVELSRHSGSGRALLEGKVIQIEDVEHDPEYTWGPALQLGKFRTLLGVPMMRDGVPAGVLTLMRKTVRPFTQKEIDLVATFADQAAIAIENVRLFESVEARTRELGKSLDELRTAQDRLVQTEKLASLGQLTAGIAHEIKNPLNFVNNFSAISVELIDELRQALAGANLDNKLRAQISEIADMLQGNLNKVVQHGRRADSIVKNMLLHSRQGSGEHRPVDINAIVEESLNLAYHGARAEKQGFNITLERSFDPAAGEVDVFPQDVTRVLLNLISNGFYAATKRKAEADGGDFEPVLTAATKSFGDSVEIRIRDNGTGIPPEVKEKIFNPFFTTKPAGEGTGLGLSISHDVIVKQHGGSIEVDTQPGAFTEFRIVLPRAAVSPTESKA